MRAILALLWGGSIGTLVYWYWFDDPVIYTKYEVTVDNPNDIHPGGELKFHKVTCFTREIVPGSSHRWLTNGYTVDLPGDQAQGSVGCNDLRRGMQLPDKLMLGPHEYHYSAYWQINPIKQKQIINPPLKFNVTPAPDPAKGDKGDKGDTGLRGAVGPQGPAGN